MILPAPFSSTRPLANLAVHEEVLYDLPPLEGVFLHWNTSGVSALTPGIVSLFSRRAQLLGPATLPEASIQLLAACASECLHTLPTDEHSTVWERRPLHARLLRHGPSHGVAETQALLPPGVLVQKTVTLALSDALLLCTGAGSRTLSRRERRAIAEALGLPYRASKHGVPNPSTHDSVERFGMLPGMVSPFLHPQRQSGLTALVLLHWPKRWDAQAREVAISHSLWESLVLPLGCLRPLMRSSYARLSRGAHHRSGRRGAGDRHVVRPCEPSRSSPWRCASTRGDVMTMTASVSAQLRQMEHPQLQEHQVWYSDQRHLLIIDGVVIPTTPSEYYVLLTLLRAIGEPIPFVRLLYRETQQTNPLGSRHRLTQRVSRLRARIWPFGLDILCLTGYGYLLFQRPHLQEASDA